MAVPRPKQIPDQPAAEIEQYQADEELEILGIGEIAHARYRTDEDSRQRPQDDDPRQGPDHAPFAGVPPHAAGNCHYVEQVVSGAHCRAVKTEDADLKRQQQKGARHAAHGGKQRDRKSHDRRNPWADLNTGDGKIHGISRAAVEETRIADRLFYRITFQQGSLSDRTVSARRTGSSTTP